MALTTAQLAALKSELLSDPLKLGYAQYIGASDVQLAAMLNATTGAGTGTINLVSITKGSLLLQIVPWLDQLATGVDRSGVSIPAPVTTKWQQRFAAFQSADQTLMLSQISTLLNQAVSDGLATTAQVTAITSRTGSRAEVLFGQGTVIQWQDVLAALGS